MPSQPSIHLLAHLLWVDPHPMEIFLQATMAEGVPILRNRLMADSVDTGNLFVLRLCRCQLGTSLFIHV